MPTSVATHASLLLKAAAAKPCFSARAAARIPAPSHRPRPPAGRRLPTTVAALAAAARRFRWPSAAASARGLCAAPHFGGEGMGSDAGAGGRKRRVPAVNGLAKDAPAVNGMRKEEPVAAPPRLLTLPTVLTIGRVAAVPLLISREAPTAERFIYFSKKRCKKAGLCKGRDLKLASQEFTAFGVATLVLSNFLHGGSMGSYGHNRHLPCCRSH
uniref:Uncharacterized protein n=1 Tax=Zea mays TaxID=4577 RepID=A0A804LIB3_MAIZE